MRDLDWDKDYEIWARGDGTRSVRGMVMGYGVSAKNESGGN